jgi:hypothetical protein
MSQRVKLVPLPQTGGRVGTPDSLALRPLEDLHASSQTGRRSTRFESALNLGPAGLAAERVEGEEHRVLVIGPICPIWAPSRACGSASQ